jgi:hypothetical protein
MSYEWNPGGYPPGRRWPAMYYDSSTGHGGYCCPFCSAPVGAGHYCPVSQSWHWASHSTVIVAGGAGGGAGGASSFNVAQPYQEYVLGVGLVSAATPELLTAAVNVARTQAHPHAPCTIGNYRPGPPRPRPPARHHSYAHDARWLGQMTALSVAVIGGTAMYSHDWSGAWLPLTVLLGFIQIMHWVCWQHRNN